VSHDIAAILPSLPRRWNPIRTMGRKAKRNGNELKSMPALLPEAKTPTTISHRPFHFAPQIILFEAAAEDNKYSLLEFHMR
jgi:hypothetical protein